MKRHALIAIIAILLISLCACIRKDNTATEPDSVTSSIDGSLSEAEPSDALELLSTVWNSYTDDERFSASGGDSSEENSAMNAAGRFSIDDSAAIDSSLGFPATEIDKIDGAASLLHMMNANTFTCGAYSVKDATNIPALATAIKDNIQQRQWICGFPDKLTIAAFDGYIISFFGENEIVDTFKGKLLAAYPNAEILYNEAIA